MHALLRLSAFAALLVVASTVSAADDQKSTGDQAAAAQHHAGAQDSRVQRHNGHWWFYTAQNNWLVWQNNAWVPYSAGMFAGNQTASQPVRRYSYNPGNQGNSGYYPRLNRAPGAYGSNRSIRYAGSKINADYAPYTGGSVQ
ncbi:MAG TPA: hypothetical protein VGN12_24440 [Pirellulales bacterium]|jgi:hypothetical protein